MKFHSITTSFEWINEQQLICHSSLNRKTDESWGKKCVLLYSVIFCKIVILPDDDTRIVSKACNKNELKSCLLQSFLLNFSLKVAENTRVLINSCTY